MHLPNVVTVMPKYSLNVFDSNVIIVKVEEMFKEEISRFDDVTFASSVSYVLREDTRGTNFYEPYVKMHKERKCFPVEFVFRLPKGDNQLTVERLAILSYQYNDELDILRCVIKTSLKQLFKAWKEE